jgi:DNA helicase HerA-like ATPase
MAQRLQSELQNNILLHQEGPYLDPSLLLGDTSLRQARVSVINLAGLPNLKVRQQFLNQLAMALLIWIKQNSAPPSMPVRGFLVMDETTDFIPAEHSVPCKENLLRFAAEAPTHGLGLIFTTQAPRNIDHTLMASSFTQFFGKASSPATIEAVQEQLKMCGGKGDDIPALESGQFYLYREGTPAPVKIAIPLCLSYHPPSPLEMAEILKRAAASRLDTKD